MKLPRQTLAILLILILLALSAQSSAQQINWYYPITNHPLVWTTPAHNRTWNNHDSHNYIIQPYGGYDYRPGWTNYRPLDTSWGYRQNRPRAKELGIRGPHKLTHPNPRSLYRK